MLIRNLNIMLEVSGMLAKKLDIQYLHALLCVETLYEFYTLCIQIGTATITHLYQVVLGLGA